jgi:hypothetical protein
LKSVTPVLGPTPYVNRLVLKSVFWKITKLPIWLVISGQDDTFWL